MSNESSVMDACGHPGEISMKTMMLWSMLGLLGLVGTAFAGGACCAAKSEKPALCKCCTCESCTCEKCTCCSCESCTCTKKS